MCLALCCFVLVFFGPFGLAIASVVVVVMCVCVCVWGGGCLGTFRTFVQFALDWFCLFPLPLGVWEGLWFLIVALSGLFFYLF